MYMYMSLIVITLFVHVTNTYSLPEPASPPGTSPPLSCDLSLRIVLPYLFLHCPTKCLYSEWTPWEKLPALYSTTKERCPSGHYFIQERKRTVVSFLGKKADCKELNETQEVCSPTNAERLILTLNLGQTDNKLKLKPITQPNKPPGPGVPGPPGPSPTPAKPTEPTEPTKLPIFAARKRRQYGDGKQCPHPHLTYSSDEICKTKGKRFTDHEQIHEPEEYEPNIQTDHNNVNIDDKIVPIPFDLNVHDGHFRHKRQSQCNGVKHVLFVLDSSGSVGQSNFDDMKNSIATLVPLFCGEIRVALINFSSKIKLEFCFNCYEDNIWGRVAASQAINNIEYMGGLTKTGETAKCICDKVLNKECGISTMPDCLRVIFITDGKSNDPKHKVCEEIKCLHKMTGVSTLALGIKGYNKDEIRCITEASDDSLIFEYETFKEFKDSIKELIERITNGEATCAN